MMPYFTLGYPDPATSLEIIKGIAPYSDLLELGIPFSDPIADGPTVQRSTQTALENGMSVTRCFKMVEQIRSNGVDSPILLMGYYNPILSYGEREFVSSALLSGVDGFIVPDLPPEESDTLWQISSEAGLALIQFLTPLSDDNRITQVVKRSSGFLYMVSVTGVTGARNLVRDDLGEIVSEVKKKTDLPVAVGFGISTPEQVASVSNFADGIIVGSAIIDAVDNGSNKRAAAAEFVNSLYSVLKK